MSTLVAHNEFLSRIAAFFTAAIEVIREARAMHAAYGGKGDE